MPHAELPSAMGHAMLHVWGYPGPSGCMLTISSHLSEPMLSADGGVVREMGLWEVDGAGRLDPIGMISPPDDAP